MTVSAADLEELRADGARLVPSATFPPTGGGRRPASATRSSCRSRRRGSPELGRPGYAVPHWPAEWGGGMSAAEQIVLYQELAAHDAPRLVLAFVSIHHAASTLLAAGTDEQRRRHLPAILDGEIWCQGFSEPEAGSDLASLRTTARKEGDALRGERAEAVGERRDARRLVPAARPHRHRTHRSGVASPTS